MLKLKHISKVFTSHEVETTALDNISLEIEQGEFVAIMGPSGCGKTTLLNILGLLDQADSGQYLFFGDDVTNAKANRLAEIRKRYIGFIFQSFNLIGDLSIFENVELPLRYNNISASERKPKVAKILKSVGISHRAKHLPSQLSGGQQQRAAIARAMVSVPKIILADEPTGNLDSGHGKEIMDMLAELNEKGTTVVMVTHSSVDAVYAKRIINLLDGRISKPANI